eukprot:gb/GECG01005382.1/.p1 GENE.gb/GECG01005382.1/~~gb/GECG01005382.1/.p1  ORF type:complete len:161 (+),score=8.80 gb/GECG01005382.1/:1-483(+)
MPGEFFCCRDQKHAGKHTHIHILDNCTNCTSLPLSFVAKGTTILRTTSRVEMFSCSGNPLHEEQFHPGRGAYGTYHKGREASMVNSRNSLIIVSPAVLPFALSQVAAFLNHEERESTYQARVRDQKCLDDFRWTSARTITLSNEEDKHSNASQNAFLAPG